MKILVFKGDLFILYLLCVGLAILAGCGDDDPADEWVGMWEVETSDDEKLSGVMNEEFFKILDSLGMPRWIITRLQVEEDFYFGDDGRWQSTTTFDVILSVGILDQLPPGARPIPDQVQTGSYIVTDDRFAMAGDRGNTSVIGSYSGAWRRDGNKLTLIFDDSYMDNMILKKSK